MSNGTTLSLNDRALAATTHPPVSILAKRGGLNDYVDVTSSRANAEHWTRLLKRIGREDLIDDQRYETRDARLEHSVEVDEIVSQWTRQHTKQAAMQFAVSSRPGRRRVRHRRDAERYEL